MDAWYSRSLDRRTVRSAASNRSRVARSSEPLGRTRESTGRTFLTQRKPAGAAHAARSMSLRVPATVRSSAVRSSAVRFPAEGTQHERGLERGHDRLPSLVLAAAVLPAAFAGLLQGVTGQHPVANWFAGVQRDPRDT